MQIEKRQRRSSANALLRHSKSARSVEKKKYFLGGLLGRSSLHTSIQTALVPARSVLVQNTLLDTLVQHRNRLTVGLTQRLCVAGSNRLTQRAQRAAQLALVGAVYRGLGLGLTCALQRRNMICHKLSSLNPYFGRGKWGAGQGRPIHSLPHSLQVLSLREPRPTVNTQSLHRRQHGHFRPSIPQLAAILHLPLDAARGTFYSVPIFGTRLAPLAIPVAVSSRKKRAAHRLQSQQPVSPLLCLIKRAVVNPASPDGGQHTT